MSNISEPTRLFVGSLPYKFSEGQLLELFAPFGRVIHVRIMLNQFGKSRGLGFVEFDNPDSAREAKRKLHNTAVGDRTIIVDFSHPDPFLTPEGQARHQIALESRPKRFSQKSSSAQPEIRTSKYFANRNFKKSSFKPKSSSGSTRQSVWDQRHHLSPVGKKFARRTRRP